jgi:hypothetical protein
MLKPEHGVFCFPSDGDASSLMFFTSDDYENRAIRLAGMLVALAIAEGQLLPNLSRLSPIVFQILLGRQGLTLDDFEFIDRTLYDNWQKLLKNTVTSEMGLGYSWYDHQLRQEVSISNKYDMSVEVNDSNKREYIEDAVRYLSSKLACSMKEFKEGILVKY